MKILKPLLPLTLFVTLLVTYFPILNWFFARDDFGFLPHLPTTLANLPAILTPPNYWFFRPLSQQFYFWLGSEIWGLNALWFRVFALGLLTFNSVMVYKLIKRFSNESAALAGLIFYGLNTLHLFEIGWVAANYQTISTTLFLLTVLLAISQSRKGQFLSFVTLILAFLASEMSVFIAPVIFFYYLLSCHSEPCRRIPSIQSKGSFQWRQDDIRKNVLRVFPYLLLTILYLCFYFSYVHLPGGSVYGRYFDPLEMARIFAKYLLYPFVAGFDRNSLFGIVNLLLAARVILIITVSLTAIIPHTVNKKLLLLGTTWFLITVSLFTLLKGHSFAYLDAVPTVGLTLILASLWPIKLTHRLQIIILTTFITLSLTILRLVQTADPDLKWLKEHQQASKTYLTALTYPTNGVFILNKNEISLMEATYFGHAISAFYKNATPAIVLK